MKPPLAHLPTSIRRGKPTTLQRHRPRTFISAAVFLDSDSSRVKKKSSKALSCITVENGSGSQTNHAFQLDLLSFSQRLSYDFHVYCSHLLGLSLYADDSQSGYVIILYALFYTVNWVADESLLRGMRWNSLYHSKLGLKTNELILGQGGWCLKRHPLVIFISFQVAIFCCWSFWSDVETLNLTRFHVPRGQERLSTYLFPFIKPGIQIVKWRRLRRFLYIL